MEDSKIIELFFARNETAIRQVDDAYGRRLFVLADNILRNCDGEESVRVKRPLLGIGIQTTALSSWYDPESGLIQKRETVSIVEVSETAPAFRVGDVILSLKVGEDFAEITHQHQLLDLMLEGDVGETVVFTVLRDGETVKVSAVLTEEHFVEC